MIEIKNLSLRYEEDEVLALDDVSLTIPEGQWLAIIGVNGSGKSTFARCLNGLLLPDSGSVSVDGLSTSVEEEMWQVRERVSFVFQNPDNQLVATSVEDDIAFGPENLGLPREEIVQRVERALDITNLQDKREKPPHLLSGGEKQRVAIAGALAMASRYLVLDEATSMLDPLMRNQVIDSLRELHSTLNLGIIYVTNIMEEVLLAERVIVLEKGKIIREGTPHEILSDAAWLQEHGLDVPQICDLSSQLADKGFESLRGVMDFDLLLEKIIAESQKSAARF